MFTINHLYASTDDDQKILHNITLAIHPGSIHVLMGTNGSGKSTLAKVIMGDPQYTMTSGTITIDNSTVHDLAPHERAQHGLFLAPQTPPTIPGVTVQQVLRTAVSREKITSTDLLKKITDTAKKLHISDNLLKRSLNENFSGGERKKMEILQMAILNPRYIILDEIDTGVDIDALKIITAFLKEMLAHDPQKSLLIITHHNHIVSDLPVDMVHIMQNGQIVQTGDKTLIQKIEKTGYTQ